jgi:hypothetical protein
MDFVEKMDILDTDEALGTVGRAYVCLKVAI